MAIAAAKAVDIGNKRASATRKPAARARNEVDGGIRMYVRIEWVNSGTKEDGVCVQYKKKPRKRRLPDTIPC
jgi:hypothetical protein